MPPFLRPLRYLARALAALDSPRQLAAGFALGWAVGLIPKSSLLAHVGLILICCVRVNVGAAYAAAALATMLSPLGDPAAHALGQALLVKSGFLAPLWTALYNMPVLPWTRFNNTVVLGWSVLGPLLAYPVYRAMMPVFERYAASWGARIRKFKVAQLLLGADIGTRLP